MELRVELLDNMLIELCGLLLHSPDICTNPDAVQEESNYPCNSTFCKSSYIYYKSTKPNAVLDYM